MLSVLSSAALGGYSMTPDKFADFCRTALAQEGRNLLNNGAAWNDDAWFSAAKNNPALMSAAQYNHNP